jgi:hypothetical protein
VLVKKQFAQSFKSQLRTATLPFHLKHLSSHLQADRAIFTKKLKLIVGKCEHPHCLFPYAARALAAHEALLTGDDLQRVRDEKVWRLCLLHIANLPILHNSGCHIGSGKPTREISFLILLNRPAHVYQQFGYESAGEAIKDFYEQLDKLVKEGRLINRPPRPLGFTKLFEE